MSENAKIDRDFKNTNLRGDRMTAQQIPIPPHPYSNIQPMDLEQLRQLMQIIDEWSEEDPEYDRVTYQELITALDQERQHLEVDR